MQLTFTTDKAGSKHLGIIHKVNVYQDLLKYKIFRFSQNDSIQYSQSIQKHVNC